MVGNKHRLLALALVAGSLAGIVSSLCGESSRGIIKPRLITAKSKGRTIRVATRHDQAISDAQNAGLAFAIVGGFLSAGLGAAGGLARGRQRAAAMAGSVGLILGLAAGIGASAAVLAVYNAYFERHPDEVAQNLILPLVVHVGIYSTVAAAGGLAFAIGLGMRERVAACVLGAMAGAAFAAITFDLIGPAVSPLARSAQIVPATRVSRVVSRLSVTLFAAAGTAFAAGGVKHQT